MQEWNLRDMKSAGKAEYGKPFRLTIALMFRVPIPKILAYVYEVNCIVCF